MLHPLHPYAALQPVHSPLEAGGQKESVEFRPGLDLVLKGMGEGADGVGQAQALSPGRPS
jgi:hypothetical protein